LGRTPHLKRLFPLESASVEFREGEQPDVRLRKTADARG
jgi:hypothetical protein